MTISRIRLHRLDLFAYVRLFSSAIGNVDPARDSHGKLADAIYRLESDGPRPWTVWAQIPGRFRSEAVSMTARFAAVASLAFFLTLSAAQAQTLKEGFIYQPFSGAFWDPSVIYHAGKYYLFAMYGGDSIWLATCADGVHWKDYGVVLKSQGFRSNRVWKPFVAKVGDKIILDHGAFTDEGSNNNLLRFYESPDLIHWKYLYEIPIDAKLYRANGRWDHMYMLPKNDQNSAAGSWGYMVADPIDHGGFGMMDSPDSIHVTPIRAPQILWELCPFPRAIFIGTKTPVGRQLRYIQS